MNRTRTRWLFPVLVSAAAVAAVPVTWAAATPSGDQSISSSSMSRPITVSWKLDGDLHTVDIAPKGVSSGDTLQARYTLTGKRRGSADYICTVVGQHYLCSGIIRLAGGDIYVSVGPVDESQPAAVVGGTRRYVGASGEFTQQENEDGTGTWTLQLRR